MFLHNGRIYTQDPQQPFVSALAIQGDRIFAAGETQALWANFGDRTEAFDLGGRTVIPGLIDAHVHLQQYALSLQKVDCETSTRAECLQRVAERARHLPAGEWILGHGWNQNDWPEGFGSAADLDAVAPHHPVYLTAKSLHVAWVNSFALQLAGLSAGAEPPLAGRLGRDADGNSNGILYESAIELVSRVLPRPTSQQVAEAIRQVQPILWRMGLTGVHDFDGRECFQALQTLRSHDELRLRVLKSIPHEDLPHAIALGLGSGLGDDFLRIGGVKLFADGALGPHTAAMLQPYLDEADNYGMLALDAEALFEIGRLAVKNGLSLAVHAIGDRANREVLNAFERLREYEKQLPRGPECLRHRIEHVQIIHPDDAPRLATLGVAASMQPMHAPSDMPMAERLWGERCAWAYAWRTQLEYGALLAFGSDAPVESPNPFWGLHAAVTRRRSDGSPGPQGWYPEQRLTLTEALRAFTLAPAFLAGMENHLGRLAPGFLADLLVLDCDPFTCEIERLRDIQPLAVMVGGRWAMSSL